MSEAKDGLDCDLRGARRRREPRPALNLTQRVEQSSAPPKKAFRPAGLKPHGKRAGIPGMTGKFGAAAAYFSASTATGGLVRWPGERGHGE